MGESPLWHSREEVFYWVDIVGRRVFRHVAESGTTQIVHIGEQVTALSELRGGGVAMVTPEGVLTLRDDEIEMLREVKLPDELRTNDGKCDPYGRMWVRDDGPGDETTDR